MTGTIKPNSFRESINDLKFSFILFKQNYKAFLSTQIFAVVAVIITFIVYLIFSEIWINITDIPKNETVDGLVGFIAFWLFLPIFLACQYGLAHDIFLSGDMHAEFKGSFVYFRKSWWRYFVLIVLMFLTPSRILGLRDQYIIFNIETLLGFIFEIIWLTLFIQTLPAVSSHNKLRKAFRENFRLLRRYGKRILTTWTMIFLIFTIPIVMVNSNANLLDSINLEGFVVLIIEMIRYPIYALASTRIYSLLDDELEEG